jgi:hypothetical protein
MLVRRVMVIKSGEILLKNKQNFYMKIILITLYTAKSLYLNSFRNISTSQMETKLGIDPMKLFDESQKKNIIL